VKEVAETRTSRWSGTWLDALAFVVGLGVAWWSQWQTADLVWSLWLCSFVVGYATIVWTLSSGLREFAASAATSSSAGAALIKVGGGVFVGVAFLFALAFFTVHFGGFHFVHSVFLAQFFPIDAGATAQHRFPNFSTYAEVFRRYWMFIPVAFLAERNGFQSPAPAVRDTAVTPEAIARRKKQADAGTLVAPYRNVIRMHLLIFFFAAAHVLRWENMWIYAVVYAVYFFPWRVIRAR
jgi:hypothetical protein